MKLLTANLEGMALDWALAKALQYAPQIQFNSVFVPAATKGIPIDGIVPFDHTEPALCLKLINEWITEIKKPCDEDPWFAACGEKHCYGNTLEETVARCVVTTWFGEWVDMPIELCSMDVL